MLLKKSHLRDSALLNGFDLLQLPVKNGLPPDGYFAEFA
jgi:hypothetical protein